jgi:N-acetylglutamate synthase/N-acetylornithine aminotransferase
MGTNKPNAEQADFAVNAMNSGLSKRELIAAMAIQGLLSNSGKGNNFNSEKGMLDYYTTLSINYADALIEALNK